MNGPELFDLWAPPDAVWSRWAKPVLFAGQPSNLPLAAGPEIPAPGGPAAPAEAPAPSLPNFRPDRSLAVVLDLPGARSVQAGLDLARDGYRPVPLFNGGHHPTALVNVQPVIHALAAGAEMLGGLSISPEAPPAFLLDADRQPSRSVAQPGRYDNRWLIFPQDFPSASFLRARQIGRVLLIQEPGSAQPADDLAHVLRRWQEAGIEILLAHPQDGSWPASLEVAKPSAFRALSYRAMAILGLRRNSAGGFGSVIPLPSSGGGGGVGFG